MNTKFVTAATTEQSLSLSPSVTNNDITELLK